MVLRELPHALPVGYLVSTQHPLPQIPSAFLFGLPSVIRCVEVALGVNLVGFGLLAWAIVLILLVLVFGRGRSRSGLSIRVRYLIV